MFLLTIPTNAQQVCFRRDSPPVGHGLLIHEVSRSHTTTHHSREENSGRVMSSSQIPLPDNTQQSQQTNVHTPGGNRTHNLSRRAAADLRLRPRGHWDRQMRNTHTHTHIYRVFHDLWTLLQEVIS